MKKKSIYNQVMCIITASLIIPIMVVSIISTALHHNNIGVIFSSIIYPIVLASTIIKSIAYGINNKSSKETLFKIISYFDDISYDLISIYLVLYSPYEIKYLLLGIISSVTLIQLIINILCDNSDFKNILLLFESLILVYLIINQYSFGVLSFIGVLSILLYNISAFQKKAKTSNAILSLEQISVLLIGLFIIFT